MPDVMKNWILNIVSLIVFITVIEIIIPGGKFRKYIHLVTGTVVVIAIITPLTGLAGKDFSFPEFQIKNTALIEKSEFDKQKSQLKENQAKQITDAYKRKLADQIQVQVMQSTGTKEKRDCQVYVAINEDYKSSSFGEILQVKVNLPQKYQNTGGAVEVSAPAAEISTSESGKKIPAVTSVRSIKIDSVVIGKQDNKTDDINASDNKTYDNKAAETSGRGNIDEKTGSLVKTKVSSLLNIPQELVLVN